MKEEIEIRDEIVYGKEAFEIGKCWVIIKRHKGKIVALRPVLNWFHIQNIGFRLVSRID